MRYSGGHFGETCPCIIVGGTSGRLARALSWVAPLGDSTVHYSGGHFGETYAYTPVQRDRKSYIYTSSERSRVTHKHQFRKARVTHEHQFSEVEVEEICS